MAHTRWTDGDTDPPGARCRDRSYYYVIPQTIRSPERSEATDRDPGQVSLSGEHESDPIRQGLR